jgi:hypothetical protein
LQALATPAAQTCGLQNPAFGPLTGKRGVTVLPHFLTSIKRHHFVARESVDGYEFRALRAAARLACRAPIRFPA